MITVSKRASQNRGAHLRDAAEPFLVNWRISARAHIWRPPTDLVEMDERYVVRVEIAGVNETDFLVTLDQNLLSIQGVRADLSERRAYHQMEINFGEFFSAVEIPGPVDSLAVTAEYQNGFLWVYLPKAQPRQIPIDE